MKKRIFLLLLSLCFVCFLNAQQKDSSLFVGTQWHETELGNGIVLKQFHFQDSSLFNSNQYISVLEIPNGSGLSFHIVADTVLRRTSDMASEKSALAAINGSFFKYNMPYNSVDYLRINRMMLAPNSYGSQGERLFHQSGAIIINGGKLSIGKADLLNPGWETQRDGDDILTSGPLLIFSDVKEELKEESFYTTRHPRTAVATKGESLVLFITVDGRAAQAAGMSLKELQSIFSWLGADCALNLDGGGSTTMYIEGKEVVNHPTDNRQFDHQGERRVANILIIKEQADL